MPRRGAPVVSPLTCVPEGYISFLCRTVHWLIMSARKPMHTLFHQAVICMIVA